MGDNACLSFDVDVMNTGMVKVGANTTVSQYCHISTDSRDIGSATLDTTVEPIVVGEQVWIAAGTYIGPGVHVGDGAVVAARGVVTGDVPAWTVVAGNPARPVKRRLVSD